MEKVIVELNKVGRLYISDSFSLYQKRPLFYTISGNHISGALNIKKNDSELVNVISWFNDFWLYIEIKFVPKKNRRELPNIFFSLSVFQGSSEDENKNQLFRAEWDNYEDSQTHAQPHWHIYTEYDKDKIGKSFEEEIGADEEDSFIDFVDGKRDRVAINRIHFAMNGQWAERNGDVHTLNDSNNLINWFSGLILHIKQELKYLIEKT